LIASPSVLIVEDEADGREILNDWLTTWGIAPQSAENAERALALLTHQHYHAAIIDLALPGMDGFRLLDQIRHQSQVPCIAITAFGTNTVRHQALVAGFNAYLDKPINEVELRQTLERILG